MSLLGCHLCSHCCKEAQLLSLVGYSPHCTSNFYIPNFKASAGHSIRQIFFFFLTWWSICLRRAKALTFLWSFGDQLWLETKLNRVQKSSYYSGWQGPLNILPIFGALNSVHFSALAGNFPNNQPAIRQPLLHILTLLSSPPSQFVICGPF